MPFFLEILIFGLILSADSFSVAVAMGGRNFSTKDLLKFSLASGGAEGFSTLLGYYAGSKVIAQIAAYDHWIAFCLLGGVALHMAYEAIQGLRGRNTDEIHQNFHSFSKILIVAFVTSLDAFGVGIGLGVANRDIWPFVISISFWAFISTAIGLHLGRSFSKKLGPIFTLIASIILGYLSLEMLKI